jgi:hypothetical protein
LKTISKNIDFLANKSTYFFIAIQSIKTNTIQKQKKLTCKKFLSDGAQAVQKQTINLRGMFPDPISKMVSTIVGIITTMTSVAHDCRNDHEKLKKSTSKRPLSL